MSDKLSLLRHNNASDYIKYFSELKLTFTVISSNYTLSINSDFFTKKFVKTMQSNRVFAAFSKIKSNIKDKKPPKIDRSKVLYFQHDIKKEMSCNTVWNIDLKSAYPNILKREGYITDDTFKYLSKIGKHGRLAAIGMLASKKTTFLFENGKARSDVQEVSPTADFFFFCAKKTFDIMSTLRRICGDKYLFTWVDGIYFMPCKETAEAIHDYLSTIDLPFSFDELSNFNVKITRSCTKVTFDKDKKTKFFNLPHQTTEFKKTVVNSILSRKTKENEVRSINSAKLKNARANKLVYHK